MSPACAFLVCITALLNFSFCKNVGCPSEGIVSLPLPDCNKFLVCSDGVEIEMSCPENLYYNPQTTLCDFPENVADCEGETRPPTTGSTAISTEQPSTTADYPRPTTENPSTTTKVPPVTMTECGQSIIADDGTIQYKLDERYDANELCVFLIKFKSGLLNTTFTLETHGISDSDRDAVTIFKINHIVVMAGVLGTDRGNISFRGYGAVVLFRSNSSEGTGFKLSFKLDAIVNPEAIPGTYAVFTNETMSPLSIPFPVNQITGNYHNYFFFTSGSKRISEPDSHFKLTVNGDFKNEENSCSNWFDISSFENVQHKKDMICWNRHDNKTFKFTTHGLFFIFQQAARNLPLMTGTITWKKY